jgi:hypothetical protein
MLTFFLRNLTSVSFYLGSRAAPMWAVLALSPRTSSTSLVSLDFTAARVASLLGISRSAEEIFLASAMDYCMRIESSRGSVVA